MKANSLGIILFSFLFLSFTIADLTAGQFNMTIITVDNEGDGDYSSIKEALANANPGDTIEVYSGTYFENNINIHKSNLTLSGIPYELENGNDSGNPIIDGEGIYGHVLEISKTSGVTVENLILKSRINVETCSIFNLYDCTDILIKNNTAMDAPMSLIPCVRCENVRIINNTVMNSAARQGIKLYHSYNCEIISNYVENTGIEGIFVWVGNDNYISDNQVYDAGDTGICIIGKNNTIENNHLENNDYGIGIYNTNNVIRKNNFVDNLNGDAFFQFEFNIFPFHNTWEQNYWNRPRILPFPIVGSVFWFVPWIQFDWQPALLPYQFN